MIILVGASASGKTEVAKLLAKKYAIKKVVTHTTRPKRILETNDVDYHFVSKEEFEKLKSDNYFVETTLYNNNYYGTSKKEISDEKALIVDPNGLNSFLDLHDPRIITFYLKADKSIRLNRMLFRGDNLLDAQKRIENDRLAFAPDKIKSVNYEIDSNKYSLLEMTDIIYKLYKESLAKL